MKSNLKGFAENALFVLNIFIIFFLIFEGWIVIPHWMIPVGRMHPMILHFPIAILILAMVLEFFRFKDDYRSQVFYQNFTSNLLLVGLLSASVTVIMGLFLSHEDGYEGSVLQWHKWTGIAIVFVASLIYFLRQRPWYNAPVAKGGAAVTILCLILAGHFGATLTHGDSFVLGPIMPQQAAAQVPIEQAKVFDDVVLPIFQNKCTGCHNPEKIKGQLMLTDEASVQKGGKTGKLFIAGKPEVSLLLQRIHLPAEDKKHMPPTGKPQLTPEEALLLQLWVKDGATFGKKVMDIPAKDSLRILAATFLKPATASEATYNFAAADEKIVNKLANDYRTIAPIAKGSPALAVNLYNRAAYSPKQLEELSEVKKQIISLDLNMLPVKDADLKTIAQFENLETLNLNFSEVTGTGLKDLAALPKLRSLSLAGSKISYQNLQQVKGFKALRSLSVWNTAIKDNEVQALQKANKNLQIIAGYKDDGKPIKLNKPELKNASQVFKTTGNVLLHHPIKGVEIRYTVDGTDPDSIKSPVFSKLLLSAPATTIRAKAFKKGWISSDVVEFKFYRSTYTPDSVNIANPPAERFTALGSKTLIDNKLGMVNNITADWLGFEKKDMEVVMKFNKPVMLSSVGMQNMSLPAYLFMPPGKVEVWGGADKDHLKLLGTAQGITPPTPGESVATDTFCNFKAAEVRYLLIKAKTQTLLLVDEIFLN